MKEQGNFDGQNMSGSALNGEKISFLPETNKSDEAKKIATRDFANSALIGNHLFEDGTAVFILGESPRKIVKNASIERDDSQDKERNRKGNGWLQKARTVMTAGSTALATALTVGSAIPAIAEEVPADVALNVNADEVRKAINSVGTAEASPAPTAEVTILDEQYDEKRYEPYFQLARDYGITDEAIINFCGRFMFSIENYRDSTDSLKSKVSTTDVLEYGLNGVTDKFDVYIEDGEPIIPIVYNEDSHDSSVLDWFSKTIDKFKENGCPNILKSMNKNGVNLIYVDPTEDGGGAVFQDTGVIVVNTSSESIKEIADPTYFFARILPGESAAIALSNMMLSIDGLDDYFGVTETGKALLEVCDLTYRSLESDTYVDLAYEYMAAIDCFTVRHDISLDDPYLIRLLYSAVNGGLVNSMNLESWSEIFNTLAVEVLGWDGVDITDEVKFGELISELHDKIPVFLGQ